MEGIIVIVIKVNISAWADRFLDTGPLRRNRAFRWFWLGTTAQSIARQIGLVAVLLQIWEITRNALWLGIAGLVSAVPMIVAGLLGGLLADRLDRRSVCAWTTAGALACSGLLVLQALLSWNSAPALLAIVAVQLLFTSAGAPARRSVLPGLLTERQLAAGLALTQLSFQAAVLVGPALGGALIAQIGFAGAYLAEAAGFGAALLGVASLPRIPAASERRHTTLRELFAGVEAIAHRPILRASLLIDLAATVLVMPIAILPVLNTERFGADPTRMGLLLSAMAVGGLAAGLLSGPIGRCKRAGLVQILAAASWTIALGALAVTHDYAVAIGLLALAGAADTIGVIVRGAVMQLETPDRLRGRVSAIEQIMGVAGPELGNARAGTTVGAFGTTLGTALSAGTALLAIGMVALLNPALRRYRTTPA